MSGKHTALEAWRFPLHSGWGSTSSPPPHLKAGKWQLNAQGRHSGRSEPQVPTAAAEQQSTPSNQILLDLQERRARRRQVGG